MVGTDLFVIARAGANFSVSATNIATFIGSTFAQWQADATLATYITPISFSNQTLPGILRLGSSSTTEAFTLEWQNGGGLGGGAILTSLDSGTSGYFQFFHTTNRIGQCGYTGSGGRWAVNSNSFTGGGLGGFTGIIHMRVIDSAQEAGLLITTPTTPGNTINVLRVADAANLFHYMDNTGRSFAPNGAAATPSWSFVNDTDCGLYRVTTNEFAVATNGVRLLGFNATQVVIPTAKEQVFYNTADETTNYERTRITFSSNIFKLIAEAGGTGTARPVEVEANMATTFSIYRPSANGPAINFFANNASATRVTYNTLFCSLESTTAGAEYSFYTLRSRMNGVSGAGTNVAIFKGYAIGSSGTAAAHTLNVGVNQSSTAAYEGLLLEVTETATGSGTKRPFNINVAAASVFNVTNTGATTALSYLSGAPAGGTAATAKFGVYIAGLTVPTGAVEFESGGVTYLLSAVAK